MELFDTFGLDVRILTAQFITFAVFFYVLYKFAIKPITAFLEKRSKSIRKKIEEAEYAKESLEKARDTRTKILEKAKKEAQGILTKAEGQANHRRNQILEKANSEANDIIEKSKGVIEEERLKMLKDTEKKIGNLAILTSKVLLEGEYNHELDETFINNAIKKLSVSKQS